MVVTRAPGTVSYVRMSAHVGDKSWPGWPPKGNDGAVRGTTVSQHFNLSFTVPPKYTSTWVSGSAALSVCGGICGGYAIDFTIRVDRKVKPRRPKPTGKPKVQAFAPGGRPAEPGGPVTLPYTVSDASGKATVHLQLYQGGEPVGAERSLPGPATGARQSYTYTRLARTLIGPLFFCVWAESKGGKSDDAPKSSCAWVPLLVEVKSYGVSNGCGGKGWDSIVAIENYFGNTHVYEDAETGVRYTVDFKPACDLHDAGYAGLLVVDRINGGGKVDYRSWSRMAVDSKFLRDMRTLCHTAATPPIPPASDAMGQCEHSNMPSSIGAGTLYGFVDNYGDLFFDADLTKPGPQELGDRKARPTGGSRDNGPPKCSPSGPVGLVHRRASTRCAGGATPPTTTRAPADGRRRRRSADSARPGLERQPRSARRPALAGEGRERPRLVRRRGVRDGLREGRRPRLQQDALEPASQPEQVHVLHRLRLEARREDLVPPICQGDRPLGQHEHTVGDDQGRLTGGASDSGAMSPRASRRARMSMRSWSRPARFSKSMRSSYRAPDAKVFTER